MYDYDFIVFSSYLFCWNPGDKKCPRISTTVLRLLYELWFELLLSWCHHHVATWAKSSSIICLCATVEFTWPDIWDPNMAFLHVQSMNEVCKWKIPNVNQRCIRSIPGSQSKVYCSMSHWPIGRNGSVTVSVTSRKKYGAVSSSLEIGWSETLWARIGGVRKQMVLLGLNELQRKRSRRQDSPTTAWRHMFEHYWYNIAFTWGCFPNSQSSNVCHWIFVNIDICPVPKQNPCSKHLCVSLFLGSENCICSRNFPNVWYVWHV